MESPKTKSSEFQKIPAGKVLNEICKVHACNGRKFSSEKRKFKLREDDDANFGLLANFGVIEIVCHLKQIMLLAQGQVVRGARWLDHRTMLGLCSAYVQRQQC